MVHTVWLKPYEKVQVYFSMDEIDHFISGFRTKNPVFGQKAKLYQNLNSSYSNRMDWTEFY